MTSEKLFELPEYRFIDLELEENEIEFIKQIKEQPIVLETISKEKQRLRTTNYIGQLVLPSSNILKIIPKIGDFNFFGLLMYTEGIPEIIFKEISFARQGKSLVDLLAKLFIKVINDVLETGIYRKYYQISEQSNTVRGRLLISQTIRSPNFTEGKIWCEYDKIGSNVLENQVILYCSYILLLLARDTGIKDELLEIRRNLLSQGVSLTTIESYQLESLHLHRLNEFYELAIKLCKYILDDIWYREFSIKDQIRSLTWLHDMNDLFEKFVTKVLEEDFYRYEILPQKKYSNILEQIVGKNPPKMKPDNVIRKNGQNMLILDTKYKKNGPDSSDFYQATAYSLKFQCDTLLLVPQTESKIDVKYKISGENLHVHVKSIEFTEKNENEFIKFMKKQIIDVVKPLLQ